MKRSILLLGFLIVLLVLSFFQISNVSATPQQYEYYNTDDDAYSTLYGVIWKAQTFTVGAVGHTVTSVKLKMFRVYVPPSGDPGTVTVSIRAVSGSGHPTGSDLTSGTIAGGSFTINTAGAWYTITLTEYTLSASTTYAIVVRALTGTSGNYVAWRYDSTDPVYDSGNFESSSNSGSTWTSYVLRDFMFEVWGNSLPDTTKPTYSNVGTNTTIVGQPCLFYTKWTDETGLATTGGFIFGTNNTGIPTNETWTAFTANPDWSNKTKTLNSTVGIRVEWWVYANDTNNNWNNTGTQYLITTSGKAWHTVSSWTASLVTRTWSSGTSWTANLLTRTWSSGTPFSFNLLTSIWKDISTWGINLSTMMWNDVAAWVLYPITRLWNDIAVWLFSLTPPQWLNVAVWTFSLRSPEWIFAALWNLQLGETLRNAKIFVAAAFIMATLIGIPLLVLIMSRRRS